MKILLQKEFDAEQRYIDSNGVFGSKFSRNHPYRLMNLGNAAYAGSAAAAGYGVYQTGRGLAKSIRLLPHAKQLKGYLSDPNNVNKLGKKIGEYTENTLIPKATESLSKKNTFYNLFNGNERVQGKISGVVNSHINRAADITNSLIGNYHDSGNIATKIGTANGLAIKISKVPMSVLDGLTAAVKSGEELTRDSNLRNGFKNTISEGTHAKINGNILRKIGTTALDAAKRIKKGRRGLMLAGGLIGAANALYNSGNSSRLEQVQTDLALEQAGYKNPYKAPLRVPLTKSLK